jgi:hypothetical protein
MTSSQAHEPASADMAPTPEAPAKETSSDVTKITATLPNEVMADLRQLAEDGHLTLSAALRQAITTSKFISDETKNNKGKLLIEKDNGELRQIVFR